jgi:hypothetical protein
VLPCFYGKNCSTGVGLGHSYFFRYEQPDLVTDAEQIVPGLGQCRVAWTFTGTTVRSEFRYVFKPVVKLLRLRYVVPIAVPHSHYRLGHALALGTGGLQVTIDHNDFQAEWNPVQVVREDPHYRTYCGKIHYLQVLERKSPLTTQIGKEYKLQITLSPDILLIPTGK